MCPRAFHGRDEWTYSVVMMGMTIHSHIIAHHTKYSGVMNGQTWLVKIMFPVPEMNHSPMPRYIQALLFLYTIIILNSLDLFWLPGSKSRPLHHARYRFLIKNMFPVPEMNHSNA